MLPHNQPTVDGLQILIYGRLLSTKALTKCLMHWSLITLCYVE